MYQVHDYILPRPSNNKVPSSESTLTFSLSKDAFAFSISRSDSGEVLFDTTGNPLVFESQYVHMRTQLPQDPNLYGLGEHSDSLRLPTKGYHRTFWNAESPFIPRGENLYSSHPIYYDHRGANGTHGVFLLNANGMQINIDQTDGGAQYLEYNIVGGVLDFYFLAGPSPGDVSQQYAEVVGLPAMMPYWAFGFHQCKYGYRDVLELAEVVANYSQANIPLEVMWSDIDYMDRRKMFTTDPERYQLDLMRKLVSTLHERGQHFVMMLDPGIAQGDDYEPYARGRDMDVFLKAEDGSNYRGVQWPGVAVFPDWLAPHTQKWWSDEVARFFDPETGIDADGAWNDMNEVSNFVPSIEWEPEDVARESGNPPDPRYPPREDTGREIPGFPIEFQPQLDSPVRREQRHKGIRAIDDQAPYVRYSGFTESGSISGIRAIQSSNGSMKGLTGRDLFAPGYKIKNHKGELSGSTIFTNTSNADGTVQYDTHNLYGDSMAATTYNSMLKRRPNKRPFVLARSTFAGSGNKTAKWFGDNTSSWEDYRVQIQQLLTFAAFHQMPMVGSDICGFNGNATETMCARWAMLGAFMPFYRNHAVDTANHQELYLWESVAEAARKAIDSRYRLLDYIYTAMHRASTTGEPIAYPLFFMYPSDENTFGNERQFFYGDALMISPVIDDDAYEVEFYMPDDIFYNFWTHKSVRGEGKNILVEDQGLADIPVHIRGGKILPLRTESANTTSQLKKKSFELVVAPGLDGKAEGSLYLDDGESIDVGDQQSDIKFTWDGQMLKAGGTFGFSTDLKIEHVTILSEDSFGELLSIDVSFGLSGPFEKDLCQKHW